MPAPGTARPGESRLKITAGKVLFDHLPDHRPELPEGFLVPLGVDPLELLVVLLYQPVESGLPGISGMIDASGTLFHARGKSTDNARSRLTAGKWKVVSGAKPRRANLRTV